MDPKIAPAQWNEESAWEAAWWGSCANTLREELLQIEYAKRMGLTFTPDDRTPYRIDMQGKSVIDIGGGPCSLLLKCVNVTAGRTYGPTVKICGHVVDPCNFPAWTRERYAEARINVFSAQAEGFPDWRDDHDAPAIDEAWIYNVLQHSPEPEKIIQMARRSADVVRIFEWIDTTVSPGHPSVLTEAQLNEWLGGQGHTEDFRQHGAVGRAYSGAFKS